MPVWIKDKAFLKSKLVKEFGILFPGVEVATKLQFSEHHPSHAASAFFPSPFREAAILTLDGVGEWSTSSLSIGNQNKITSLKEIRFPIPWDCLFGFHPIHRVQGELR